MTVAAPRFARRSSLALSLTRACLVALLGLASVASTAAATSISATATTFTGSPLEVTVTADDAAVAGSVVITLSVSGPGQTLADLRGLYLHVANESLLAGLSITGAYVTSTNIAANGVQSAGPGNNLNGGGSPCPCDLGVELGTPGIGSDDLKTATIKISHATQSLDVSLLLGQSFGVRATSVGPENCREGSSKLKGVFPTVVPEPNTALLMGLGLAALATGSRRR